MIAADMAFHERMVPVFGDTFALDWLETWDAVFETFRANYVILGRGHPTT